MTRSCVSASIAAGRAPSADEQAVQALVAARPEVRSRAGVRYQVAPSNRSARAWSTPGGLGAGERVAADEALVGVADDERALGRADVGDHAVRRRRRERLADGLGQGADRRRDEHGVGARRPRSRASAARSIAPRSSAAANAPRSGSKPAHLGAERAPGRRARSSRRSGRRRGPRSASAQRGALPRRPRCGRGRQRSSSSTSTVVSQPMQPSVIDWP